MKIAEMMKSHRYADVAAYLRKVLQEDSRNRAAIAQIAAALRAIGNFHEAASFFELAADLDKKDEIANRVAPGRAPYDIDIACLHWLSDDHSKAVQLMHGLAAGIRNGSIKYGDLAGGMSQGLLLYYMSTTANIPKEVSYALKYLRNRVRRAAGRMWPGPIANYLLGDISFEAVMAAVDDDGGIVLVNPDPANEELGRRKRLVLALFYDGVKSRLAGDEAHCLARMRECYSLENPLNEQEWYLARYEVEKANNVK